MSSDPVLLYLPADSAGFFVIFTVGINTIMTITILPRRGRQPRTWCTGPDPMLHEQYRAWSQTRAQANYRGEAWDITFDQWVEIWAGNWHRRGRAARDLCLCRTDPTVGWHPDTVHLVTRREHCRTAWVASR